MCRGIAVALASGQPLRCRLAFLSRVDKRFLSPNSRMTTFCPTKTGPPHELPGMLLPGNLAERRRGLPRGARAPRNIDGSITRRQLFEENGGEAGGAYDKKPLEEP